MEFFLQTLVKRGKLSQRHMLSANQLLMLGSSLAAFAALEAVACGEGEAPPPLESGGGGDGGSAGFGGANRFLDDASRGSGLGSGGVGLPFAVACAASFLLNFFRRGRECSNVALAACAATAAVILVRVQLFLPRVSGPFSLT